MAPFFDLRGEMTATQCPASINVSVAEDTVWIFFICSLLSKNWEYPSNLGQSLILHIAFEYPNIFWRIFDWPNTATISASRILGTFSVDKN